jgi:tRNA pseudouridine55 synthase
MDAVAEIRRRAGGVRTGHAGTLDPLASGVLIIALGKATKCIDRIMATDKRYRTTIDLSAFTTTDDREGERTHVQIERPPNLDRIQLTLRQFVGDIMQRPPAFSAVKVEGKRAYALARKGAPVHIESRPVRVHSVETLKYDWPFLDLDIHCDKGVYVRSLARDIGTALSTGGHCASIRRTSVGPFTLDMAGTIEQLPQRIEQGNLMSIDEALRMVESG